MLVVQRTSETDELSDVEVQLLDTIN